MLPERPLRLALLALCSLYKLYCCCCSHLQAVALSRCCSRRRRVGGGLAHRKEAAHRRHVCRHLGCGAPAAAVLVCFGSGPVLTAYQAWTPRITLLLNASCAARQYYFNPAGKRFRSRQEARRLHPCMPVLCILACAHIPFCSLSCLHTLPACCGMHVYSHILPCTLAHMCHHASPDGRVLPSRS